MEFNDETTKRLFLKIRDKMWDSENPQNDIEYYTMVLYGIGEFSKYEKDYILEYIKNNPYTPYPQDDFTEYISNVIYYDEIVEKKSLIKHLI